MSAPLLAAEDTPSKSDTPSFDPALYRDALKALPVTLKGDPIRQHQMETILQEAKRIRDLPLVTRANTLEELRHPGERRIGNVDKRADVVEKTDPKKAELFAVGSSDLDTTAMIGHELPLMAAAYVITGDHSYVDRIVAQLRETARWDPLQRPGWMLYKASNSLPPDGNDGVWLATGQGLAAIWQTLNILPKGTLPPDVMTLVQQQFKREADRIASDWQQKKMWFVQQNVVTCNQWVVPAAGQAIACATLGREADPVAYDMAVTNLLSSVEGMGKDGSASEGAEYSAHWTAPFLYMAAQAMTQAGDNRLASHSFFQKFPTWLAMQFQPGQWMVNDFDNFGGARELYYAKAPDVARLVVLSQDRSLAWTLRNVIKVLPYDFYGLLSLTIPDREMKPPPLWGIFDRGHCAIWRSSWDESASGVWVKGANALDGHDHDDRGHVNFIVDGKAVLIEAATPGYDHPLKKERYDSVMGHNVLQVGDDLYPKKMPAPITVNRMDAAGGDLVVNAGAGYPSVKSWQRQVNWTGRRIEIKDEVVLNTPNKVLFRWHLGSEQALAISAAGEKAATATLPAGQVSFTNPPATTAPTSDWSPPATEIVETPAATLEVQADQAIACTEEKDLDHAFRFRQQNHLHTTLVVRSVQPVESITIKTTIEVPEPPAHP